MQYVREVILKSNEIARALTSAGLLITETGLWGNCSNISLKETTTRRLYRRLVIVVNCKC